MARLRHRPTSPDSGFRPINVSRAEISRMQEETNRIVSNMERNRRVEYQQGQEYLRQLQANSDYTERAQERNLAVERKNIQTEILQSQLDAQTAQKQSQLNVAAATQVFGALADFSKTAADLNQKKAVEEEVRAANKNILNTIYNEDIEKSTLYNSLKTTLKQQGEVFANSVNIQEAQGVDRNSIAKARASNPATSYLANKGNAAFIIETQSQIRFERYLNSDLEVEYNGQMVPLSSARNNPELLEALGVLAIRETIKHNNLLGLEDRFLAPGIKAAYSKVLLQRSKAAEKEYQNTVDQQFDLVKSTLLNNPNAVAEDGAFLFRRASELKGYSKAHDLLKDVMTATNPDGEFKVPLAALANLDLYENNSKYSEEHTGRYDEIVAARNKKTRDFQKNQIETDNLAYRSWSNAALEQFTADPTQANADFIVKTSISKFGKVAPELLKAQASYTIEAQDKERYSKMLLALPYVNQETIDAGFRVSTELGTALQKKRDAQEAPFNTKIYKRTEGSLEGVANGITVYGNVKADLPTSNWLRTELEIELKSRLRVMMAGDPNLDTDQSAMAIARELEAEVRAGSRDPSSEWFRDISAPSGAAQFPNRGKGNLDEREAAKRAGEALRTRFSSVSRNSADLEKLLKTRGAIIPDSQIDSADENYRTGQKFHPAVLEVARLTKLDPPVIHNYAITAAGKQPAPPPPSFATTEQLVSPEFRAKILSIPTSNRSARGLGSANTFNPAVVHNNLGPTIQADSQATGLHPSYLTALSETYGTYGPEVTTKYTELFQRSGDPVAAAISFFADAGFTGSSLLAKQKQFSISMYKHGGGIEALKGLKRAGFTNKVVQLVHGNEAMQSYRGGSDQRAVFYDAALHSGANEHVHAQLKTREDVAALKQLAESTIDPFSGQPYRITSEVRPGDPGAHGSGLALDIAPPVSLPIEHEAAWYHEFFRQMGMNPFKIM